MRPHAITFITFSCMALAVVLLLVAPAAQSGDHQMLKPTDLKWADVADDPRKK